MACLRPVSESRNLRVAARVEEPVDTNVLIYAVDKDSPFHNQCRAYVLEAREDPSPAFLTWNVCYEFLRVTTHSRVSASPWTPREA